MNSKENKVLNLNVPRISIPWNIAENQLIRMEVFSKSDMNGYLLNCSLFTEPIDLILWIKFDKKTTFSFYRREEFFKDKDMEVAHYESFQVIQQKLVDTFGKPNLLSRMFSSLNKPFKVYKWNLKYIKIKHEYQDSVSGLEERFVILSNNFK